MTTRYLAALQERAQRRIAAAEACEPLMASVLREVYAIELLAAETEEHEQETARRFAGEPSGDLQASAAFWKGEAARLMSEVEQLQEEIAQMCELKTLIDGAQAEDDTLHWVDTLTSEDVEKILVLCGDRLRQVRKLS